MEPTYTDNTSSSDHRTQIIGAHRSILMKHASQINPRLILQRKSQTRGLHKTRRSRKYKQVIKAYLQVPTGASNGTPACNTYLVTREHQHICNSNGSGAKLCQIQGAPSKINKMAERHIHTAKCRNGEGLATRATHGATRTRLITEPCT